LSDVERSATSGVDPKKTIDPRSTGFSASMAPRALASAWVQRSPYPML